MGDLWAKPFAGKNQPTVRSEISVDVQQFGSRIVPVCLQCDDLGMPRFNQWPDDQRSLFGTGHCMAS